MNNHSEKTIQQPRVANREELREELEATRASFQTLVSAFDEKQWHQKISTSDWTAGEIMTHLTWALEQLPAEVASAKRGKGMFNGMPDWLADPLSYWYTRWLARKATPQSLGRRYDVAMDAVIQTLDEVKDGEWTLGAPFYGHGFYSIADLFHTPAEHLAEHITN